MLHYEKYRAAQDRACQETNTKYAISYGEYRGTANCHSCRFSPPMITEHPGFHTQTYDIRQY